MSVVPGPYWILVEKYGTLVIGVIAIIISIITLLSRGKKRLSFSIESITNLLNVQQEIAGRVKILFEDQPVQDVKLVKVELRNSGNRPILKEDFIENITLSFGEKAQILSVSLENNPESLNPSMSINGVITLYPLMLNDGDSITFNVMASNVSDYVTIEGRIVGVKKIQSVPTISINSALIMIFGFLITVFSMIYIRPTTTALFLGIFGYVIIFFGMFLNRRTRERFLKQIMGTINWSKKTN